ncbi:MAG TPA: serine/threonine-protein phosphatase, partial [Opitutaceae bacterium]
MTNVRAAWLSSIGNVRKENEDRILFNEAARLFGVADGVGGLPGGSEAAQTTVDMVTEAVVEAGPEGEVDLKAIVTAANEAVSELG